jgi:ABC-type phosphate/phosphonate transport system substrate-binding protein
MNFTRTLFFSLLLPLALPLTSWAQASSLTLGIFPNLPAHKLVAIYQPLAIYLTQQIGISVRLASAKNFREFYQATRDQKFDFIITAPNLAGLAMTESNYQPLARYTNAVAGLLVSKRNAGIESPAACRNKTIALTDPLTIVHQLGTSYLLSQGLQAGIDYKTIILNNHTNAALAVMINKADCAIIGNLPYSQMADDIQQTLHVIGQTSAVASQLFMSAPTLDKTTSASLRKALLSFSNTPEGVDFAANQRLGAIIVANKQDLAPTQSYAITTQSLLAQP